MDKDRQQPLRFARTRIPVFNAAGQMIKKVGPEFFETDEDRHNIEILVTRRDGAVSCIRLKRRPKPLNFARLARDNKWSIL